jgi:bifunctional UDP-N-acetylglucosamine pyrophosphorylase/glucosamine-1-phosphate N-acetyltransferase
VQRRLAETLMRAGTAIADPARFDVRGALVCGDDVSIDVGCVFEGRVALGDGVRVGPYCVLRDTEVGAGTEVLAYSMLDGARVGAGARVGPYARLRPGAELADEVHVGNFVEVKASTLGRASKANHLAYVGDSTVGERVNIGAGTITANYDGANKHRTVIGDDASIGSNAVLVAPVEIGGARSRAAHDRRERAPGELTIARAPQVTVAGWKRPAKKPADGRRRLWFRHVPGNRRHDGMPPDPSAAALRARTPAMAAGRPTSPAGARRSRSRGADRVAAEERVAPLPLRGVRRGSERLDPGRTVQTPCLT